MLFSGTLTLRPAWPTAGDFIMHGGIVLERLVQYGCATTSRNADRIRVTAPSTGNRPLVGAHFHADRTAV
jgi:hypothetical protein